MARNLVKIGEASRLLGTSPAQLRKWDQSGELRPARRTRGGTRYYALSDLGSWGAQLASDGGVTVCYVWASGGRRDRERDRQEALLESHCARMGWTARVVRDDASGAGLRDLIDLVTHLRAYRVAMAEDVDLPAVGASWLNMLCETQGVEIVVVPEPIVAVEPPSVDTGAESVGNEVEAVTWQPSLLV